MSETDSFIDEVTEEVRRDKLFKAFRKYGWIGGVVVVAIVGGAAWNEWSKSRAEARAEAFGDAVLDALDLGAPEDRRAALAAAPVDGEQVALLQLMLASDPGEDKATTLAALDSLIADTAQPELYRDLAVLRRVSVAGADMALADRRTALEPLSAPGRAFRVLALEQLALLLVEEGKTAEAVVALTALMQDQQATAALKRRAGQLIVALGAVPPATADQG